MWKEFALQKFDLERKFTLEWTSRAEGNILD
jgi:hypothetical protein